MSQVREALNPGLLEGDLQGSGSNQHVQSGETFAADNVAVAFGHRTVGDDNGRNRSNEEEMGGREFEEEGPAGGGHDSDPPIENQNPEDGDGSFEEVKHYVEDEESGEGDNGNAGSKNKSQFHHRKRKKSIHNSDGTYVPPYKKNRFRRQVSVLPSKFLLGGNIRDPLNLASLADAKVNAEVNKVTPKSSPLPVPSHRQGQIPVFIPKNPDDPLGLSVPTENPTDIIAGVRTGKHKKHRHRRRHGRKRTESECSASTDAIDEGEDDADRNKNNLNLVQTRKRERTLSAMGTSFETSEEDEVKEDKKDEKNALCPPESKVPRKAPPISVPSIDPQDSAISSKIENIQKSNVEEIGKAKSSKEQSQINENGNDKVNLVPKDEKANVLPEKPVVGRNDLQLDCGNKDSKLVIENASEENPQHQAGVYPCKSSEYVPLSSSYAPSPYVFDTMNPEDGFEVKPFESPSLTNYCCNAATPSHLMEPFSPPPRPEIPHFQRRMQMMSSIPHRHQEMSLRRAVFQKPFYRRRFRHKSDPIVSPVIPQPGCRRNHHHHHHNHRHNNKKNCDKQGSMNTSNTSSNSNQSVSKKGNPTKGKQNVQKNEIKSFRPKDEVYQFGNYKQYYGYRTTSDGDDPRLWVFKKELFREKDVLDIGCNIGHVTLSIARDFDARRVHGIDIDNNLITTARKNIKHYMIYDPSDKNIVFPHSLPMIYGAMQPPSGVGTAPQQFPFNVMFSQENYVLSNDTLLETVKPEYDVVICLSVTKWIHLNFGDDGLKRFFRRIYCHLRKGGKLILEPQEWSSYYRKRKLTAKINENYKNIRFLPEQFQDFLVNEVGFTFVQTLGTPHHAKGFQRPILILCKESNGDSPMSDPSLSGPGGITA